LLLTVRDGGQELKLPSYDLGNTYIGPYQSQGQGYHIYVCMHVQNKISTREGVLSNFMVFHSLW